MFRYTPCLRAAARSIPPKSGRPLPKAQSSRANANVDRRAPATAEKHSARHNQPQAFESRSRAPPPRSPEDIAKDGLEQEMKAARARKFPLVVSSLIAGCMGLYGVMLFLSLTRTPEKKDVPADVSDRYDETASTFDDDVDRVEYWMGLEKKRKKLTEMVKGHVLEVSVGTGRNIPYYVTRQCESITLLDKSLPMLQVARSKWKDQHPAYFRKVFFKKQSALDPIAPPPGAEGYDTVMETMGLCSTPDPVGLLHNIESVTKGDGQILLLEHGKSHYEWVNNILDKHAPAHADKHGCWWNKDIGKIVEESGLDVVKIQRSNFGTTWWVELKPRKGKGMSENSSAASHLKEAIDDKPEPVVTQKQWWSLWR